MEKDYFKENDRRWIDVRSHFQRLTDEIPTDEILSCLGNCLTDSQMQKFQRKLENNANASVNVELLQALRYHEYWWKHLTNALIRKRKGELLTLMGWSTEPYDPGSIESSINRSQNASRRVEHRGSDGSGSTGHLSNNFANRQGSDHGRQYQVARDYSEPSRPFVPEENIHREEATQNNLVPTLRLEEPSRAINQEYTTQFLESREDSNFRETPFHNARLPHDAKNQIDPGHYTGEESTDTGIEAISEESATSKTPKNNQQTSPEDNICQWPNRSNSRVSQSRVPSNNTHWPNEGEASIQDQKLKAYKKQKNLLDSVTKPRATSEHPPLSSNLACNLDEEKHPQTSKDKIILPNIQSEEKPRMSIYIKEATNELKQLNIEHSDVHANENLEPIPTMSSPENNNKQYDSSKKNNLNGNSLEYLEPERKQEPDTEHKSKSSPSALVCVDDKADVKSSILLHNNNSFNFQNGASAAPCAPETSQSTGSFTSISSRASSTSTTSTIDLHNELLEVNVARLIPETLPENGSSDASVPDTSDPSSRILQGNHRNDKTPSSVKITFTEILPLTDPNVFDPCRTATTNARVASDECFVPVSTTCSDRSDASDPYGTDSASLRLEPVGRSDLVTSTSSGERNASESGDRATSIDPRVDLNAALENRNRFASMESSLSSINLSDQHASISLSRLRTDSLRFPSLSDIFNDSGVRRSFSSAVYDTIFR